MLGLERKGGGGGGDHCVEGGVRLLSPSRRASCLGGGLLARLSQPVPQLVPAVPELPPPLPILLAPLHQLLGR